MRKTRVLALSIISGFSAIALATSTIAWFAIGTHISFGTDTNDVNVTGGSVASYYESGSGAIDDKYVISDKIHLYNLAWLQYIGYYNAYKTSFQENAPSDIVQCYFELKNDINMDGLTLPPIGTEKYPFLGNFDGRGYTISNFTISNDNPVPDSSDFGVAKPANFYSGEQSKIVGFFGVVGKLPDQNISYTSSIVNVSNLTLKDFTVTSKTSQTLIGLAAGYMNGDISAVRVAGTATIDLGATTKSAVDTTITSRLTDYGLVGYTTRLGSNGSYSQELSEYYNSEEGASDPGDAGDWGGSVNPRKYSRMLFDHYITGYNANGLVISNLSQNTDLTINSSNSGNFKIVFRSTAQKTQIYNNTQYSYYTDPDYFNEPVDGTNVRNTSNKSVLYHVRDGAYIPLRFSDETYTDTHDKNTGFIVGSSSGNAGSPKFAAGYVSNIVNAMSNTSVTTSGNAANNYTTMAYSDSSLEVITYSTALNNWYLVKDSHNANHTSTNTVLTNLGLSNKTVEELGFEKYNDSRESLKGVLETAPRLNALKFDNTVVSSSNLLSVTSGNIKINGESYQATNSKPYQFPKGSIDFNLKKTGFINFFAGTYYLSTTNVNNFSFFTLNHIARSGGTISSIKKISEIYQNKYWTTTSLSNSKTNPKFFYKYSDGTFSNVVVGGSTRVATLADRNTSVGDDGLVFKASYALESPIGTSNVSLFKKAVNNLVFYFEVPVNDGEYAIGMAENPNPTQITSFTGAYMMYLDIGANADTVNADKIEAYSINTIKTGYSYPSGVDFAVTSVGNNGGESIGVYVASSSSGSITFSLNEAGTNIAITDSSSISTYSFQGTRYSSSDPPSGKFTVSGNSPGSMSTLTQGGTRVLTINLKTTDEDEYQIQIIDYLTDANHSFDENDSEFYVNGEKTNKNAVTTLSEDLDIDELRDLVIVATLVRTAGIGEFITTYDTENCSNTNKIVDVDIETNGSTMSVSVNNSYTFKIGGTIISNGSTYPAS